MKQIGFLTEWQLYAQKIEGDSWVGDKLDEGKLSKMSGELPVELCTGRVADFDIDEQIAQLYELMQAIQKRGQDGESKS